MVKRDLALLGGGYWGKNLARNFLQLGALHTICEKDKNTLERYNNQEYADVELNDSFDQLLSNKDIDKIAIALPAALHYRFAKAALLADKHVFVEKPLCLNIDESKELIEIANKRNRILMVGHLLQYHPCVRKIQELVSVGELGQLQYITSNRLNLGKIRKEENALWSFAPHDLSVILSLAGNVIPELIQCVGGSYLTPGVADTTLTTMKFANNIRSHVYVSWLNPFKEQKLTVVGSHGMLVFDDTQPWEKKLTLYKQHLIWTDGSIPTPNKSSGEYLELKQLEPLKEECDHFLICCEEKTQPKTDGEEGLRVLQTLQFAQESLESEGKTIETNTTDLQSTKPSRQDDPINYQAHPSSIVDEGAVIGDQTKIWHFCHISKNAVIGEKCSFGQNCMVGENVSIGNNVKVQNNVSIYAGVEIEDNVFLGPSCVLTNVSNPRSEVNRQNLYEKTLINKGCSVGANATITPGITLGKYSFISAGAVVTKDVPDYAIVKGIPAKIDGWISRHGHPMVSNQDNLYVCPESGLKYEEVEGKLVCLDLDADNCLPDEHKIGKGSYRSYKTVAE